MTGSSARSVVSAEYAARVLEREAKLGDRTLLFVRADSLFYFLTGRPVPTPIDLMLPGIFITGDDVRMRESLRAVDAVFYNPTMLPSIPLPETEFVPQTSAYLAKYLPPDFIHFMNTRGAHKVMFASDHPALAMERAVEEARKLDLRPGVAEKFLYENAQRVFFGG